MESSYVRVKGAEFQMIPYTPETEHFAPFPIEEALWKKNDVGIRRNPDFDNGGSDNDSVASAYSNEDDLIKVDLIFDAGRSDIVYSLQCSDARLKVWKSSSKGEDEEYLFVNGEVILEEPTSIWVEYTDTGNTNYSLTLVASDSTPTSLLILKQ